MWLSAGAAFGLVALGIYYRSMGHLQPRPINLKSSYSPPPGGRSQSDGPLLLLLKRAHPRPNLACREVHGATDQCAFILQNCPDEQAGILDYLSLYYCTLHHYRSLAFFILAVWIGFLFLSIGLVASDFFVPNLSTIASSLHMSASLAGVTLLAAGNGAPDVAATFAAMSSGSGSLATGELIGAAHFMVGAVAGSVAIIHPFQVPKGAFIREVGCFAIAVTFTLVFISDGRLHLWECILLVSYYICYAIFVVVWDLVAKRRERSRRRKTLIRNTFALPDEADGAYHDEVPPSPIHDRPSSFRARRSHAELEQYSPLRSPGLEDLERVTELQSHMQLNSRSSRNRRTSALARIRPSLLGALEFRAVQNSLLKSALHQHQHQHHLRPHPSPLGAQFRAYSEDAGQPPRSPAVNRMHRAPPSFQISLHTDDDDNDGNIPARDLQAQQQEGPMPRSPASARLRTRSANDMTAAAADELDQLRLAADLGPIIDIISPTPTNQSFADEDNRARPEHARSHSASEEPAAYRSRQQPLQTSPILQLHSPSSPTLLVPPGHFGSRSPPDRSAVSSRGSSPSPSSVSGRASQQKKPLPHRSGYSRHSSGDSATEDFPHYCDSPDTMSIHSHSRSHSRSASFSNNNNAAAAQPRSRPHATSSTSSLSLLSAIDEIEASEEASDRHLNWWPYALLPPPQHMARVLFPTVAIAWAERDFWARATGLAAAPAVFLFKITVPVMAPLEDEGGEGEDEELRRETGGLLDGKDQSTALDQSKSSNRTSSTTVVGENSDGSSPKDPTQQQQQPPQRQQQPGPPQDWQRWLVCIQILTAPLFTVLIFHLNQDPSPTSIRLFPTLILSALLLSSLLLLILLLTTTSTSPPRYRLPFCTLGFTVSIALIASIANEVVGVLKTVGVILNISDSILGLTLFAVFNSLGDLVSNLTIARSTTPVTALAACIGGPHLSILLGIGLGGAYMTVQNAERRRERDPGGGLEYRPYEIEVSPTLVVSTGALLLTLVGMLVLVPLNGWRMDKRVGVGLIALWVVTTVVNVGIEVWGPE